MSPTPISSGPNASITCRRTIGIAPEWNTTCGPIEAIRPSAVYRALLKSLAAVTIGETETSLSAIACSSLIASSLWRRASEVTGSGGGTAADRERAEQLLDRLRFHVLDRFGDVAHVERDVMSTVVRVQRELVALVGCAPLEQLDVRAGSASNHPDLLDDRARVHVE